MEREKQIIEEMAKLICNDTRCKTCIHRVEIEDCNATKIAKRLYNAGYRKGSEVIDKFVERLLDAFPENNRDNRCPSIYYDDYRYIIEELAEKMKGAE